MMRFGKAAVAVGGALMLASTVGCTFESPAASPPASVPVTVCAPAHPEVENRGLSSATSLVKAYGSIQEFVRDSDYVAVAAVSEEHSFTELLGAQNTNRTVHVRTALKGDPSDSLVVFELSLNPELDLTPGTTHVLFLRQYEMERGKPLDKYVLVGGYLGDFTQEADGTFTNVDSEPTRLPKSLPADPAQWGDCGLNI